MSRERLVYRVTVTVTFVANEDDGDVHLALRGDDGSEMIAEAPEPACTLNSRDRPAILKARLVAQDIEVGDKVAARGVGFIDFFHNQNGREEPAGAASAAIAQTAPVRLRAEGTK